MKAYLLLAIALIGCGGDDEPACGGNVASVTSTATGTIVILGEFSEGQPIMELTTTSGPMLVPAANYNETMADFTGLTVGTYDVTWLLSCFAGGGQATIPGPATVTVQ